MASLWALLSAPDAAGAFEWLTRLARGLGTDDPRGIDARRADLMVALLTGQLVAGADITSPTTCRTGTTTTAGTDAAGQDATGPTPAIERPPATPPTGRRRVEPRRRCGRGPTAGGRSGRSRPASRSSRS